MNSIFIVVPKSNEYHVTAVQLVDMLRAKGFGVTTASIGMPDAVTSEHVFDLLRSADLVLSYWDSGDARMAFELGIATGLGKQVALLFPSHQHVPEMLSAMTVFSIDEPLHHVVDEIAEYAAKLRLSDPFQSLSDDDAKAMAYLCHVEPESLSRLSPQAFERLVVKWLEMLGYDPDRGIQSLDSSVAFDVVLKNFEGRGTSAAVEIKKLERSQLVPIGAVQQLLGAATMLAVPQCLMITQGGFTNSAREFAMRTNGIVRLWSIDEVVKRLFSDPRLGLRRRGLDPSVSAGGDSV